MGKVILCTGKTANIPYRMKKLGFSIYSVEELCYCIREHTFLMDEEVVCRELAEWLKEECGLAELASTLFGLLRKRAGTADFLTAILEYTAYYPANEIRKISQFLKADSRRDEIEKKKQIGDYLAFHGKYELAMEQYRSLLTECGDDTGTVAGILHNMGYVSSRLFLFEQAAKLFLEAYSLSGEPESLIQFLAAKRLALDEKGYVEYIAEGAETYYEASMELEKRVEQSARQWESSRQAAVLDGIRMEKTRSAEECRRMLEDAAQQLREKYRRMMYADGREPDGSEQ